MDVAWSETIRVARLWAEELRRLFARGAGMLGGGSVPSLSARRWPRGGHALTRSRSDRMVKGVCGGVAAYLGLPSALVRLVFIVLFFAGVFPAVVPYVVLAMIMPESSWENV